ncbi:hypothetical protein OJ996_17405 [Luteolibacter sp. GHJ8]|uniref:Lipoprotein n=1 Tax=Luteolibacter rhizosphaerae TaxID=2989719 RepID=A0ABT3G839_9BACT|nr:hypothetical protein [Luteolibacter rhizosphaerae]MCW1915365.1 hypothetical protein [Luteolibacter rhizosphaerae]
MKMLPLMTRPTLCVLVGLSASCASTKAWRHKDQSVTVARKGTLFSPGEPTSYWLVGAKPGQIQRADDVSIYRKQKGSKAIPLNCTGFIDTTHRGRIEVQIAEKMGGNWQIARVNGTHKLRDENAPKPFYHWLIP